MHFPRRILTSSLIASLATLVLTIATPQARAILPGPKGDIFAGYSRTGNDTFYRNAGGLNGWEGAFHMKVKPFLGAEADLSHYGLGGNSTVPHTTVLMFGPRLTVGAAGFRVFGHGLVGGEHSAASAGGSHSTALSYALGAGLDVPILPLFGWRFQLDRISAPTLSPSNGTHARFSTGIVFHF